MTDQNEPKPGPGRDYGPTFRIQEGYLKKGGQNTSYQITTRPGSPAPMNPASKGDASSGSAATPEAAPTETQKK